MELVRDIRNRSGDNSVVYAHTEDSHAQAYREQNCFGRTDRLGCRGFTSAIVCRIVGVIDTFGGYHFIEAHISHSRVAWRSTTSAHDILLVVV